MATIRVMALLAKHAIDEVYHKKHVIALMKAANVFTEVATRTCNRWLREQLLLGPVHLKSNAKHHADHTYHAVCHRALVSTESQGARLSLLTACSVRCDLLNKRHCLLCQKLQLCTAKTQYIRASRTSC